MNGQFDTLIAETRSSMPAKHDVTMKMAVLLITCAVFATLLTLDTGVLISWALSWMVRGVAHWWALLFVPLAIVAVQVWHQKRRSASARRRVSRARPSGRLASRHAEMPTSRRRRRKPIVKKGQR